MITVSGLSCKSVEVVRKKNRKYFNYVLETNQDYWDGDTFMQVLIEGAIHWNISVDDSKYTFSMIKSQEGQEGLELVQIQRDNDQLSILFSNKDTIYDDDNSTYLNISISGIDYDPDLVKEISDFNTLYTPSLIPSN